MAAPPVFKRANFDAAAGDIAVVAAAGAGIKIAVHAYVVVMDAANGTYRFEDGAAGTALTGIIDTTIDAPVVVPFSPVPYMITSANTALSLEATTAGAAGHIIYSEVA